VARGLSPEKEERGHHGGGACPDLEPFRRLRHAPIAAQNQGRQSVSRHEPCGRHHHSSDVTRTACPKDNALNKKSATCLCCHGRIRIAPGLRRAHNHPRKVSASTGIAQLPYQCNTTTARFPITSTPLKFKVMLIGDAAVVKPEPRFGRSCCRIVSQSAVAYIKRSLWLRTGHHILPL